MGAWSLRGLSVKTWLPSKQRPSLSKFLRAAPPYHISYYSVCAAWCNLTIDWPQETQLVFVDAAYQLENLPMQFPIHRGSTQ